MLLMFAGQMGCEALNFVLKRIIKEERPKRMWILIPQCLYGPMAPSLMSRSGSRNVRQRLRHAVVSCAIRFLLRRLHVVVSSLPTCSFSTRFGRKTPLLPSIYAFSGTLLRCRHGGCQSDLSELPYPEAGPGRLRCWNRVCAGLVSRDGDAPNAWLDRLGIRPAHSQALEDTGFGGK